MQLTVKRLRLSPIASFTAWKEKGRFVQKGQKAIRLWGWRIARFAKDGSPARRIASAINWLREHYAKPLRIDNLADVAHMSRSPFHPRVKLVTALSPLQYQKRLRLIEARRLMLGERIDAADAGHRVGYQSSSQFSREYARLFGASPSRDLGQLTQQGIVPGRATLRRARRRCNMPCLRARASNVPATLLKALPSKIRKRYQYHAEAVAACNNWLQTRGDHVLQRSPVTMHALCTAATLHNCSELGTEQTEASTSIDALSANRQNLYATLLA